MQVKVNNSNRARGRLFAVVLSIVVIVGVVILMRFSTAEDRKTVSVVRLKTAVAANSIITADMLEEYEMYYKEFEQYGIVQFSDGTLRKAIVDWDSRDLVVDTRYAAYYLREGTVLFWDSTVKEQTKKNSYLYSMDGELLNINMNTADFGDMVVPGDSLNIRVRYEKTDYSLSSEEEYKMMYAGGGGSASKEPIVVTEMLFNEVTVLDMLNSQGNSIFDIYYDYISKSKAQQNALLQDSEFLKSVQPATILLEVTAEEADRYMEISSKGGTYLMTLLPRTGSNSIIDSLAEIQSALNGTSKQN